MADALVLGASGAIRGGSSPFSPTTFFSNTNSIYKSMFRNANIFFQILESIFMFIFGF